MHRLRTTIRRVHDPDPRNLDEVETREITAEAESYDEAHAALMAQVPDGWHALEIRLR